MLGWVSTDTRCIWMSGSVWHGWDVVGCTSCLCQLCLISRNIAQTADNKRELLRRTAAKHAASRYCDIFRSTVFAACYYWEVLNQYRSKCDLFPNDKNENRPSALPYVGLFITHWKAMWNRNRHMCVEVTAACAWQLFSTNNMNRWLSHIWFYVI